LPATCNEFSQRLRDRGGLGALATHLQSILNQLRIYGEIGRHLCIVSHIDPHKKSDRYALSSGDTNASVIMVTSTNDVSQQVQAYYFQVVPRAKRQPLSSVG